MQLVCDWQRQGVSYLACPEDIDEAMPEHERVLPSQIGLECSIWRQGISARRWSALEHRYATYPVTFWGLSLAVCMTVIVPGPPADGSPHRKILGGAIRSGGMLQQGAEQLC